MKKYLTPSIEINKFDVEDIITASGVVTSIKTELGSASQSLYSEAVTAGAVSGEANVYTEYNW